MAFTWIASVVGALCHVALLCTVSYTFKVIFSLKLRLLLFLYPICRYLKSHQSYSMVNKNEQETHAEQRNFLYEAKQNIMTPIYKQ